MGISLAQIRDISHRMTLSEDGDANEKKYGKIVTELFPNYEIFWKDFVVPCTNRVEIEDKNNIFERVHTRETVSNDIIDIISLHYSVFTNLAISHFHLESIVNKQGLDLLKHQFAFEGFYTHLCSASDIAEYFLQQVYLLLLECRGQESRKLQKMKKENFLNRADKWYEQKYLKGYGDYLDSGKPITMNIPPQTPDVLDEYYQGSEDWKNYQRFIGPIRYYRNVIIHMPGMGILLDIDEKGDIYLLVPKKEKVGEYNKWSKYLSNIRDANRKEADFVKTEHQMSSDIENTEKLLNALWKKPIQDMKSLVWEEANPCLLDKYDILLT